MADIIDNSVAQQEMMLAVHIQNARIQPPRLTPKEACHNCDEPLSNPQQLFCDVDCAEDYDKYPREA